jgi:hypothetical protein
MSDNFIRALRGDWQAQDHGATAVLQRVRRNRWTPHVVLAAELAGCVFAVLVGLWFAWMALQDQEQKLLFALSAAVLLLTAPALAVAGFRARRASLAWADETPESLLKVAMGRADATLRAIRVGRWHLAIIAIFVTMLWVIEALGFLHAIDFLVLYTAICLGVSVVAWVWMRRGEKRARGEIAACTRMLAALQVDSPGEGISRDLASMR